MARENDVVDFRPAPDFLVMLSDHLYMYRYVKKRIEKIWPIFCHGSDTYLQQIEGKPAKGEEENDDDHHFDHLIYEKKEETKGSG